MSNNSEFPEGRPKDMNGVPLPSQTQVKDEAIRDARIAREKAIMEHNWANSPVAGHDWGLER